MRNKIKIQDLQDLKKEAEKRIEVLEDFIEGRNICDVMQEHKLIVKNRICIDNCNDLIKTLSK